MQELNSVYDAVLGDNSSLIYELLDQAPMYADQLCDKGENKSSALCFGYICSCLIKVTLGQNFDSMLMRMKIQDRDYQVSNLFTSGTPGLSLEVSTATTYCIKVLPDAAMFPIRSGVGNGVEILLDLETFDNGDLLVTGDGLDVMITEAEDYSLTELRGFSVGPGSSVDVQVRPFLYKATDRALNNFHYLNRKCIDPTKEPESQQLDGMTGNYSLANCLVSATLTEICNKCVDDDDDIAAAHADGSDILSYGCEGLMPLFDTLTMTEGKSLQCIHHHMHQVGALFMCI
jgi:hypothetical protein